MKSNEVLKLANTCMKENSVTTVVKGKTIKNNTGDEFNQLKVYK